MKRVLFWFLFLISTITLSQNPKTKAIDSLLNLSKSQKQDTVLSDTYNQISKNYIYENSEKGIQFAKKGLALAQKSNWSIGIGTSYMNIGMHLVSIGKYDEALSNFKVAEKKFNSIKDKYYLAKLYNEIGILKANQSKYPEALSYFYKALSYFEVIKNQNVKKNIGSCYENIGTIYNLTNSYEKAIENYEKSIAILQKIKNKEVEVAINMASIGTIYQKQNNLLKSIKTYENAETFLNLHKDDFASAFINSWMGSAYLLIKKYDISIEKSNKALIYLAKIGDKELTSSTIQNLGYAQYQKGILLKNNLLLSDGFNNIFKSLQLYKQLGNQEGIMKSYLYLSEWYSYKNDFKSALENHKLYTTYNDSIFNFKNKQSLQNLEDERTISLRNKQIQVTKLTLASKEKQKWFLLLGLAFLAIIGSLLFYQSRNRKKTNEKLKLLNSELDEANKAKTRFFSILNHDLRGPVANLIFFLQLQKESPELLDEESIKRMHDKTMTGAENLLTSMEDILQWSKSQMENFKPQPKKIAINSLFDDVRTHFLSEEKVKITFENANNIQINTDENYLKTIIRNLTGNAIKALESIENPTILWTVFQESGKTFLSITDNGKGASDEQFKALYDDKEVVGIKTGLGLHLIRDLAKAIDCEIKVDTKLNQGTTITLLFKQ